MTEDLFGDDKPDDGAEFYAECREQLLHAVEDFADEYELDTEELVSLLLDLALSLRTVSYFEHVEHPSASGMKLDLDRLRRQIDDLVRAMKKEAEERLALYRAAAEAAEEEGEPSKE
jgi:hypothetical protein